MPEYNFVEYKSWSEMPTWAKIVFVLGFSIGFLVLLLVGYALINGNYLTNDVQFNIIEINLIRF